jgi:hypothetical protein
MTRGKAGLANVLTLPPRCSAGAGPDGIRPDGGAVDEFGKVYLKMYLLGSSGFAEACPVTDPRQHCVHYVR